MYMSLKTYFDLNFALCHLYKWSLEAIENMMPWEREVWTTYLQNHLEQEEKSKER